MNKIIVYIFVCLISIINYGCYKHFPLNQDIKRTQNEFKDQFNNSVKFPEIIKNNITLFTMIYTNCPDICPMTTHNMQMIYDKLNEKQKRKVKFVVITLDPQRDTPEVLKEYAVVREYDFSNWIFLSGDDKNTNEVMLKFNIKAIKTDTTYDSNGNLKYYIMHTDRLSLIDSNGFLKKNYKGSVINVEEVIKDINLIL